MQSLWVVLLLAVCSVTICYSRHVKTRNHHKHHNPDSTYCFSEDDLEMSPLEVVDHFVSNKMRWEKYSAVNLVHHLENADKRRKRRKRAQENTCPLMSVLKKGLTPNERSISPWTYRIDTDETRYPQKLAFAHCLCSHCINAESGKESSSLNSVLVSQTMLVLRKKTCPHAPTLSTFALEYISVPVACTCSVPLYDD